MVYTGEHIRKHKMAGGTTIKYDVINRKLGIVMKKKSLVVYC